MITWSDDPEPSTQPGFVLTAVSFLTGAALSWLLLVRPLFRWVTGTH